MRSRDTKEGGDAPNLYLFDRPHPYAHFVHGLDVANKAHVTATPRRRDGVIMTS